MSILSTITRAFGRKATEPASQGAVVRAGRTLGIWQDSLGGVIAREVNPHLYEALREALPVLDGAINRLVTVDGIIRVRGDNDALVQEIERELLAAIPVNDAEAGLQAFYASQGGEVYEQGLSVGEMVLDERGKELIALRVADSKGIAFSRDESCRLLWWYRPPARRPHGRADGTDTVEAILRSRFPGGDVGGWLTTNGYVQLDPARMVYTVLMPEADNPYGTSLLRSMEFVSQILLKIQNATGQSWDRFGDPPFQLTYKVKNRAVAGDQAALERRQKILADDLSRVLNAKRLGNSADFVRAIAAEDEIQIQIIGAKDQVLEIEMPAQHMLEQIVAKTGLPSWMLGFHWSTAERLAKYQSEMVLQESRTRFERRLPGLRRIVETFLRGRGRTWKPGDWELWQDMPNLQDELQRAQARFLEAQTALMIEGTLIGRQGNTVPGNAGAAREGEEDPDADAEPGTSEEAGKRFTIHADGRMDFHFPAKADHVAAVGKMIKTTTTGGEPWAQDDPQLPAIESRTTAGLLALWRKLEADTLAVLGLPTAKAARKAEVTWVWQPEWEALLRQLMAELEIATGSADGDLVRGMIEAWTRGAINANTELGLDAAIRASRDAVSLLLHERGMQLVRTVIHRTYEDDLLNALAQGAYNGESPGIVARELRKRFGAHDYDWERLARSEIAQSQALGKEDEYRALGVEHYDYLTAEDERVSTICRTHAANGPYAVGQGPLPMRDSHPNCFPAGTLVTTPRVNASSARWYEGNLVEIVTAAGHELAVTPNHPILTPSGWVAAGSLVVGSDVVSSGICERVVALIDPDDHHVEAHIADLAVTLGGAVPVPAVSVPATPEDFHGDGMQANIDVVGHTCQLRCRHDVALGQHGDKSAVGFTHADGADFAGHGALTLAQRATNASPAGLVGFGDLSLARIAAQLIHPHGIGLPIAAQGDAALGQEPDDGGAADAESGGETIGTLASLIALDQIVCIRLRPFEGHVYNLETETGWYFAAGIIVHNCRCTIAAVIE